MTSPRRAYLWMLLGAASFSVMSFLTHRLSSTYSWQTIAVVRTAVALVLTVALARAAGAQLVFWRPGTLWIRSFAGSVALLANFYSMTHYPISEVLALSNMFPLWVAVLSWPVLGEKPRLDVWLAAACGVAGVYFLQLQAGAAPQVSHVAGTIVNEVPRIVPVITAVVASLASAVALLGLHRLHQVDARAVVAHFSGVSMFFSLIAWAALPGLSTGKGMALDAGLALLMLGIAGTAGQLFLTKAFASGPPAQVSVVGLTQIGFAMLLESTFEQREFASTTLFGLALVIAPTAWVMTRRRGGPEQAEAEVTEPLSDV